jgi:hypothetical protein
MKRLIFAEPVSFATILALPDTGQTGVAEVGLESELYRSMFCDKSEGSPVLRTSGPNICAARLPPVTALLGLPLNATESALGLCLTCDTLKRQDEEYCRSSEG